MEGVETLFSCPYRLCFAPRKLMISNDSVHLHARLAGHARIIHHTVSISGYINSPMIINFFLFASTFSIILNEIIGYP